MSKDPAGSGVGQLAYVIIDSLDPGVAVPFWCAVLGRQDAPADGTFTNLTAPGQLPVAIQHVGRLRPGHRVHIDVDVADLSAAVKKVISLGGQVVKVWPKDWHCVTMSDMDGNHFCLVDETAAQQERDNQ